MPDDEPTESRRGSTATLGVRYATGLTFSYLVTAMEVAAVVITLSSQTVAGARTLVTGRALALLTAVILVGTVVMAVAGYRNIAPSLRCSSRGRIRARPWRSHF